MRETPEKKQREDDDYPPWHVKKQTAYRVHRFLMVVQIFVALFLAGLIWWGVNTLLP